MNTLFNDKMHKKINVYVDEFTKISVKGLNSLNYLQKIIVVRHKYNLKLNPPTFVFVVTTEILLEFIVSHTSILFDPSNIKTICYLSSPKRNKELFVSWDYLTILVVS